MITEDLKVVGINTLTSLKEQGISFALPINLTCQPGSTLAPLISCPTFQVPTNGVQSASLKSNDKLDEIVAHYKKIFSDLKTEWKQKDEDLKEEIEKKAMRVDALKAENPGAVELIASYENEVKALTRERYERQVRYIRQAISLYERQKGEAAFTPFVATIDQYIETLRLKDRALSEKLSSIN